MAAAGEGRDDDHDYEYGDDGPDELPSPKAFARVESDHGLEIPHLAGAQPRAAGIVGKAGLEAARLLGGLAAPQQPLGLAAAVPLEGDRAQAGAELGVVLGLVEPAAEQGPGGDERLVDQLDGALDIARALDGEQASVDEAVEHAALGGGRGGGRRRSWRHHRHGWRRRRRGDMREQRDVHGDHDLYADLHERRGNDGHAYLTCMGGNYNCPAGGGSCVVGGGGGAGGATGTGGAGGGGGGTCVNNGTCTGTMTCMQTCMNAAGMTGTRTCTCMGGNYNCPFGGASCVVGGGGGAGGATGTGGAGGATCVDNGTCTGTMTCTQTCTTGGGMPGTRTCACMGGNYNCPMGGGSCVAN